MVPWCSGLAYVPVKDEIAGSNPVGTALSNVTRRAARTADIPTKAPAAAPVGVAVGASVTLRIRVRLASLQALTQSS